MTFFQSKSPESKGSFDTWEAVRLTFMVFITGGVFLIMLAAKKAPTLNKEATIHHAEYLQAFDKDYQTASQWKWLGYEWLAWFTSFVAAEMVSIFILGALSFGISNQLSQGVSKERLVGQMLWITIPFMLVQVAVLGRLVSLIFSTLYPRQTAQKVRVWWDNLFTWRRRK